jgi:hypothetical protein
VFPSTYVHIGTQTYNASTLLNVGVSESTEAVRDGAPEANPLAVCQPGFGAYQTRRLPLRPQRPPWTPFPPLHPRFVAGRAQRALNLLSSYLRSKVHRDSSLAAINDLDTSNDSLEEPSHTPWELPKHKRTRGCHGRKKVAVKAVRPASAPCLTLAPPTPITTNFTSCA